MTKSKKHFRGAMPRLLAKALLKPDEAEKLRPRRGVQPAVGNQIAVEKIPPNKSGDQ